LTFELPSFREYDPYVRARIPRCSSIVAQQSCDLEARLFEAASHLGYRQRAERQRELANAALSTSTFGELLVEDREPVFAILAHGLDQCHVRASGSVSPTFQAHTLSIFLPRGKIGDELDAKRATWSQDSSDLGERRFEITIVQK